MTSVSVITDGRHARLRLVLAVVAAFALFGGLLAVSSTAASAADTLLSQGKTATASSTENGGTPAADAVDGNTGTRWSSAFSDPQWLQVDLGATATISSVTLNWEAAYGQAFQIQTSPDGTTWASIYSTTTGTGGVQNLSVTGSGRYVRMYGTARGTGYGYGVITGAASQTGTSTVSVNATSSTGTPQTVTFVWTVT